MGSRLRGNDMNIDPSITVGMTPLRLECMRLRWGAALSMR